MKVTVNPVCPDFQPLSMDTVTVKGVSDEPFSVKLVQHSPERKDLVLYDSAFPAAAADAQRILMYYTVSLTGTAPQWESEPSEA